VKRRDTKGRILLHEARPRYDWWLKLILGGVLALTLMLGLVYIPTEPDAAWILLGITVFDAVLFWAILPQRFLIYEDRLVIKLGGPFAVNVKLADIKEAKPADVHKVFMYWGTRFATSTSGVVEIVRHKGMGIIISPADPDMFLEQLKQARH
jgi:hypothetical protein